MDKAHIRLLNQHYSNSRILYFKVIKYMAQLDQNTHTKAWHSLNQLCDAIEKEAEKTRKAIVDQGSIPPGTVQEFICTTSIAHLCNERFRPQWMHMYLADDLKSWQKTAKEIEVYNVLEGWMPSLKEVESEEYLKNCARLALRELSKSLRTMEEAHEVSYMDEGYEYFERE